MTAEEMRGLERSTDPPRSDGGQAGNTSPDCLPGTRKLPSMNLGERPGPTAWSQALVHREPGQRSCEQCPVRTRKRPALRLRRDSPPPHLHSDRRARGQQPLERVTEGLSSGTPTQLRNPPTAFPSG